MIFNADKKSNKLAKICLVISLIAITAAILHFRSEAAEKKIDPNQLFYTANHSYESRDYLKAIEGYTAILDQGLESGNLFYNIGNSFLKSGRLGLAILYYEKAARLIPNDSDLKANLAYALSLAENVHDGSSENILVRAVDVVSAPYNLREVISFTSIIYLSLVVLLGIFIANPFAARKLKIPIFLVSILFLAAIVISLVRCYDELLLKHGIVVQKDVACKYEPIEKSTTYYTLKEGEDVRILHTRSGWRQIARPDGKISWVNKDAVDEI